MKTSDFARSIGTNTKLEGFTGVYWVVDTISEFPKTECPICLGAKTFLNEKTQTRINCWVCDATGIRKDLSSAPICKIVPREFKLVGVVRTSTGWEVIADYNIGNCCDSRISKLADSVVFLTERECLDYIENSKKQ